TVDRVARRRQSVLDLVSDEFEALKGAGLGKSDREKLDLHFSTIRDLEVAMTGEEVPSLGCSLATATEDQLRALDGADVAEEANYKLAGDLWIEVRALACACNQAPVATLGWGSGAGGPTFQCDGMDHEVNHHKMSHGAFFDDCFPGDARDK